VSDFVSTAITSATTLLAAYVGYRVAVLQEKRRNEELGKAAWNAVQAGTITDLGAELTLLKEELAKGVDPEKVHEIPDLVAFRPRNRAMTLCTRIDNQELGVCISKYLEKLKDEVSAWSHLEQWENGKPKTWLAVHSKLGEFDKKLGKEFRLLRPPGVEINDDRALEREANA